MRVGDATLYARFLSGLRFHKQNLSDALQALADGKRVRSASDDPPGAHASLALRARLTRIEGFDRSAQAARTDLATLDRVLGEITNLLTSARAEAMAGASGDVDDANDVRADAIDAIRAQVLSPREILRSATVVNAEILGRSGELGTVAPGALADLLVVDGDPLENLSLPEEQGKHLPVIMKGGQLFVNRLS